MGYTHSRSVMAGLDTVNDKGTDGHASYPDCEGVDMLPYRQGRILPPVDCKAGDGERYSLKPIGCLWYNYKEILTKNLKKSKMKKKHLF